MYANKQLVNSENYFLNKSVTELCYMIVYHFEHLHLCI